MGMSKTHTPGPWKVVHNSRNRTINVVSAPDVDGESVKVALVNYQDEANANLIASAPDLRDGNTKLRAELADTRDLLKEALEWLDEYTPADLVTRIIDALKGGGPSKAEIDHAKYLEELEESGEL
jgi:hypothetical protein